MSKIGLIHNWLVLNVPTLSTFSGRTLLPDAVRLDNNNALQLNNGFAIAPGDRQFLFSHARTDLQAGSFRYEIDFDIFITQDMSTTTEAASRAALELVALSTIELHNYLIQQDPTTIDPTITVLEFQDATRLFWISQKNVGNRQTYRFQVEEAKI